jgi:phosphopantetheinyl transferase (holo-ACP synthase)
MSYIHTILSRHIPIYREDERFTTGLYIGRFSEASLLEDLPIWHMEEKKRFRQYHVLKRRESYLMGRYAAKQAIYNRFLTNIERYSLSDICIGEGIFHFPVVSFPHYQNLQVCISHNDCYAAALAFSEHHPMGIDIEKLNGESLSSDKTESIRSLLTVTERERLVQYSTSNLELLLLYWTAKEALSKVLKTGLMTGFSLYEIDQIERESNVWKSRFKNFPQYKALTFRVEKDAVCSIVLPRKSSLHNMEEVLDTEFSERVETEGAR